MRSLMTRHPIASFLALFYGLGWACFIPSLLGNQGFGILKTDIPLDPFRLLEHRVLRARAVRRHQDRRGPGSAGRLLQQVRHVRVGPQWYLVAFFGPPAALFVVAVLLKGTAPIEGLAANLAEHPDRVRARHPRPGAPGQPLGGDLLVRIRDHAPAGPLRPAQASLIVAPLFGLYHLPLFFIIGGLSDSPDRLPLAQLPLYARSS